MPDRLFLSVLDVLENARGHPSSYGLHRTYYSGRSFLTGVNVGSGGVLLSDFGPWLTEHLGLPQKDQALAWFSLVARHACPEAWTDSAVRTDEDEARIFDQLLVLAASHIRDVPSDER